MYHHEQYHMVRMYITYIFTMWYQTCHVKCITPPPSKAKVGVNIDSDISLKKYLIIASGVLVGLSWFILILQKAHQTRRDEGT